MQTERILPKDRAEWLTLRRQDVTSTDASVLFGVNPYRSLLHLWQEKHDPDPPEVEVTERMTWGTRLQDAIARGVAEDKGWQVRKINGYWRLPDCRCGASFDFEVVAKDDEDGPGLLEIKTVDRFAWGKTWSEEEVPPHVFLQVQQQMLVSGRKWAYVAALFGGNDLRLYRIEANIEVLAEIRRKVREFWSMPGPPEPDFSRDANLIDKLVGDPDGTVIDATAEVDALVSEWSLASATAKVNEEKAAELKARILYLVGGASKVTGDRFTISNTIVKEKPGKTITPDMVGQMIGGRKGYRTMTIKMKEIF